MRLLLDTHTLLWWVEDAPQLSAQARQRIPPSMLTASSEFGSIRSYQ